jgi:transposase InsO family protein
MERVFRTMKEELLQLRGWYGPFELVDSQGNWVEARNRFYLHSKLDYKSPAQFA